MARGLYHPTTPRRGMGLMPTPARRHATPYILGCLSAGNRRLFSVGIQLTTRHAFDTNYSMNFRPQAGDNTLCPCSTTWETWAADPSDDLRPQPHHRTCDLRLPSWRPTPSHLRLPLPLSSVPVWHGARGPPISALSPHAQTPRECPLEVAFAPGTEYIHYMPRTRPRCTRSQARL